MADSGVPLDLLNPFGDWEAEVKIRRKGRLIAHDKALGSTPEAALFAATTEIERWAQEESHRG